MNEMSKSPSDDEKDHLDPERESETSLWKAPDADDNVKDEHDGCSGVNWKMINKASCLAIM